MTGREKLKQIAAELEKGQPPEPLTVRQLLEWFSAQRRGYYIVQEIRGALEGADLQTEPDFEGAYIDGPIQLVYRRDARKAQSAVTLQDADPTYRIGKLRSANTPPVSVAPDQEIAVATTIMLHRDFSQLPVMNGERNVRGVISWASIGSRLALGIQCNWVRECMVPAHIISADKSLFDAINKIVTHQYVLVHDSARKICGIVTTSDLSLQFRQLAEPYLLLGEIENHIRRIIQRGRFTTEQLQQCRDPNDANRSVDSVSNLTFGEYIRLLENPKWWAQASLTVDRRIFIDELKKIGQIRNDVMHFDPDGITDDNLKALQSFTRFLQALHPGLPRNKSG